ncbi:MAG TPA: XdhC family protein [Anaerolineales bacterium]|nr:XdhC family protein [Anaerolineales bacterium]
MRDILPDLEGWLAQGKQIALATVVQTWGSSPRRAGSKMAIASDGRFAGSVSGGCVENAVIEAAQDVIQTGQARLMHFGVADETAWEVGLACGGSVEVFVQPLNEVFFDVLRAAWTAESLSVHGTFIRGSDAQLGREFLIQEDGSLIGNDHASKDILELAKETLGQGKSRRVALDHETEIFLELVAPPPTLIAVGGVHITVALVSLAKTMGFRTVLIDPRAVWGNQERFPNVDQLIQAWIPDAFQRVKITSSTAVVMLTHDPKLDDPALKIALKGPAFYIGALGSKTTNAKRRERLLDDGLSESQLSRLHAPIGLDIGAETPEEIALAIMAEVVEAYRRREQPEAQNAANPVSNH